MLAQVLQHNFLPSPMKFIGLKPAEFCSEPMLPALGRGCFVPPETPALGAGGTAVPSVLIHRGRRGKNGFRTEFFLSLLSSEGAFSGIVNILIREKFSGAIPQPPVLHFITRIPIY